MEFTDDKDYEILQTVGILNLISDCKNSKKKTCSICPDSASLQVLELSAILHFYCSHNQNRSLFFVYFRLTGYLSENEQKSSSHKVSSCQRCRFNLWKVACFENSFL